MPLQHAVPIKTAQLPPVQEHHVIPNAVRVLGCVGVQFPRIARGGKHGRVCSLIEVGISDKKRDR